MTYFPGDILLVPIVYTDGSGIKKRPVVVICDYRDADVLVAPVTSQAARSSRDMQVQDWQRAGLRSPSIARMEKLATMRQGSRSEGAWKTF